MAQLRNPFEDEHPQTELCQGQHHGCIQFGESSEDGRTHFHLDNLSLKRSSHHFFAQSLEAIHLRFFQRSGVVAVPVFPDCPTESSARCDRFVAVRKRSAISWRNDGDGVAARAGLVRALRVVPTIASDAGDAFILRNLVE